MLNLQKAVPTRRYVIVSRKLLSLRLQLPVELGVEPVATTKKNPRRTKKYVDRSVDGLQASHSRCFNPREQKVEKRGDMKRQSHSSFAWSPRMHRALRSGRILTKYQHCSAPVDLAGCVRYVSSSPAAISSSQRLQSSA